MGRALALAPSLSASHDRTPLDFFLPQRHDAGRLIEQYLDCREQLIGAERLGKHDSAAEPGRQRLSTVTGDECERAIFLCQQGDKFIDRLTCEVDVEERGITGRIRYQR